MNLRSRFAWVRVAGLVSVLGLVACDSGSADSKDAKKAEPVKAAEPVKTEPAPVTPPVEAAAGTATAAADAKPADTAADAKPEDTKPADAKPADAKPAPKTAEPKVAAIDGKPLYDGKCKVCHGADGKGTEAMKKNNIPDMTDKGWQGKHSKAVVAKAISDGIDGTKMKAFKDKFKPEEIDAIAVYVKKMK